MPWGEIFVAMRTIYDEHVKSGRGVVPICLPRKIVDLMEFIGLVKQNMQLAIGVG
jgi:hypothetical protein